MGEAGWKGESGVACWLELETRWGVDADMARASLGLVVVMVQGC